MDCKSTIRSSLDSSTSPVPASWWSCLYIIIMAIKLYFLWMWQLKCQVILIWKLFWRLNANIPNLLCFPWVWEIRQWQKSIRQLIRWIRRRARDISFCAPSPGWAPSFPDPHRLPWALPCIPVIRDDSFWDKLRVWKLSCYF